MEKIDHRLEVLDGLIIAFLNLDRVIDIIRYDDDPKLALMHEGWGDDFPRAMNEADYVGPANLTGPITLTEVQAEAILNMRLRALRRLEEVEIKKEHAALKKEQKALKALLAKEALRWDRIAEEIRDVRARFGAKSAGGKRRTEIADAPAAVDMPLEDINGNRANLKSFQGKWVVVNYWATWCPPCIEEMPELQLQFPPRQCERAHAPKSA